MLGKREWENEVARNILVLYKANMSSIRKAEADRRAAANLKETMEKMGMGGRRGGRRQQHGRLLGRTRVDLSLQLGDAVEAKVEVSCPL